MPTVVLPSREAELPTELARPDRDTDVQYLDEEFTDEAFERAYLALKGFRAHIRDSAESPWEGNGVSLTRIVTARLFNQKYGDLKHLIPFARGIAKVLRETSGEVVLVWPHRDRFTQTAIGTAAALDSANEFSVRVRPEAPHPTAVHSLSDLPAGETGTPGDSPLRALFRLVAIHVLVLVGKLFPGAPTAGRNLIYAEVGAREVTADLLSADGICRSILHPRLFPVVESLGAGRILRAVREVRAAADDDRVALEDLLGSVSTMRPETNLRRLLDNRSELAVALTEYLADHHDVPYLPEEHVESVVLDLFSGRSFLKLFILLQCVDPDADLASLTTIHYGEVRRLLTAVGERADVPVVDLDHTVLRADPLDYYGDADVRVTKSELEREKLQETSQDSRLPLCGRPYFDLIHDYLVDGDRGDVDLPPAMRQWDRTLVVATEPVRSEHMEAVIREAAAAENVDGLCLKLHPRETCEDYARVVESVSRDVSVCVVENEYPLWDLLDASTVVVTVSSNVGLEALFLGTAALHVDVPSNLPLYYQSLDEFGPYNVDLGDLAGRIEEFVEEGLPAGRAAAIRDMYLVDGDAAARLVSKVYEHGTEIES